MFTPNFLASPARELLKREAMTTERTSSRTSRPRSSTRTPRSAAPRSPRTRTVRSVTANDLQTPAELLAPDYGAIAVRAYEIFLGRSGSEGDAVGDWLQAEQELAQAHNG